MGKQLIAFISLALKGGVRDRILAAIFIVGALLLFTVPVVAIFSMRQVVALATSYSLSLISLTGLLLTLFLAMTLLARDLEQGSVYAVCSLPISRSAYLLGKFLGLAILIFLALAILGCFSAGGLFVLEHFYPGQRPLGWGEFALGLWFQYWVFLIVGGITVLFTTVATSHFLPLALSVGLYFASYSTEAVRYFIQSSGGEERLGPVVKIFGRLVYWVLPNFSAFDLKAQIIYGVGLDFRALLFTQLYGIAYLGILLVLAMMSFSRRDFL
jgi:ABC-type transport system involved in multi-copper enzyme maturation permease subunit